MVKGKRVILVICKLESEINTMIKSTRLTDYKWVDLDTPINNDVLPVYGNTYKDEMELRQWGETDKCKGPVKKGSLSVVASSLYDILKLRMKKWKDRERTDGENIGRYDRRKKKRKMKQWKDWKR